MKKFLSLVLILGIGLSINGTAFAQDTGASDGSLPPCAEQNGSAKSAGGVLISDFTGVLISDFTGVLISDFTGVLISDFTGVLVGDFSGGSDGKGCKKE